MRPSRFSPPAVAIGMFVACLLLATGAREATHLLVRVSTPSAEIGLTVSVRSGLRGMRVENLTDTSWSSCVVTLEGGVSSMPFAFPAKDTMRLDYQAFRAGSTPLDGRADGFVRAFHQTSMLCRDAAGQWRTATFR